MSDSETYTLGQLIDIAESNNPSTRVAWARAKVSADAVGIARSELYPTLVAIAVGRTYKNPPLLNQSFVLQDIGLLETALNLNYTLLDFGARRDEITAAQARLLAANFSFNNSHLIVIYQVTQTYYSLLNAMGLREAAAVNLSDAQALEQAAQARLDHGLATLPDVLEARAATTKAEYDLQNALGAEQVAFGNLATTLTATPTQNFRVQKLDDLRIPEALDESAEASIEHALEQRPDLLAQVARVRAANAEVKHARAAYYPTIDFQGQKGWVRAWGQQTPFPGTYGQTTVYDAQLGLQWTIFDGFKREKTLAQAKAEKAAAEAEVHEQEDMVADQVWQAYSDATTALQQRKAAESLLVASSESYSAASEAYQDGVRNILDVLSAERELAGARAADVTARTQVLKSFANLAFRTGDLLTQHPKGNTP